MIRIVRVAIAALVWSTCASGAMAQWTEDFQSYVDGPLLLPWESVWQQNAQAGKGYPDALGDPTVGSWTASVMSRGNAFRMTGGGATSLTGKLLIGSGQDLPQATIGFTTNTNYSQGGAWFASEEQGCDTVYVTLYQEDASPATPAITFGAANYDDLTGEWIATQSISDYSLEFDEWYWVEIEIVDGSVIGRYAYDSDPATWITIAFLPLPPGFAANYVGISSRTSGCVDDVGIVGGVSTTGDIEATVNLLDYPGDLSLIRVAIQVLDAGDQVVRSAQIAPTSTTINHTFVGLVPGTYSIRGMAPQWLTRTVTGVEVVVDDPTPAIVSLPNGDADGDNEITTTDLSVRISNKDEVGT